MVRAVLALLILDLSGSVARAATEVTNLYFAQTVVTGTVEPERTRGFRTGLSDVVVKLTGDARLADNDALAPLLDEAGRFVADFDYEDRMKGIPVHDEQGTRERPHYLRIHFKPADIDQALDRLGVRKWPAQRPVVAVWLGIETAIDRYVLTASGAQGYGQRAVLVETADRRGVPVRLPESEPASLTFKTIADGDRQRLAAASDGAEALLFGTLSLAEGGFWNVAWTLRWQERSRSWALHDVTFDTALKDAVQTTALVISGHQDAGDNVRP